ncbi:MAG: stage V sporulation protein S [Firmicutes bacterium]|nr:stage V sporulation protein S [Bacillota bacterium]
MDENSIKVSARSNVAGVAGAIAGMIRDKKEAEIQVIGAGALNQAVKAVIVARGFLAPEGTEICVVPSFAEASISGEDRTAIRLKVITR